MATTSVIHTVVATVPRVAFLLVLGWMAFFVTSYAAHEDGTITSTSLAGTLSSWRLALSCACLMPLAVPTVMSNVAIMIFVTAPFARQTNKRIHIAAHTLAVVSVVLGTFAVFRFHNEHGYPNFRSAHSWIGVVTLAAFASQYVIAFLVFFFPGASPRVRTGALPYHTIAGLCILVLVAGAFCTCRLGQF
ncbi:Aste57867_12207 [Aphanomyces stellatus]|uniref:Aste57867_12207 protein n=1 Tax=Aphanomyces stellatus TaxID=120398 RepID=A0A485KUY1_9STRA|nr:hypothetical protein As57867_012162 [Aphanomyces stellatus]VFT89061.1 Aste57867_12207 [Aphanomyces stellatus]